jgi:hypothetical protein
MYFDLDMKDARIKPKWVIANEVRDFFAEHQGGGIDLWANYGAYDHVCLMQLWGPMIAKPSFLPMWTHDLQQELERLGGPFGDEPVQEEGEHNALADAKHNLAVHNFLMDREWGRR